MINLCLFIFEAKLCRKTSKGSRTFITEITQIRTFSLNFFPGRIFSKGIRISIIYIYIYIYIFGHFFDKNYVLTLNAPHVKTKCRNKNASETFAGRIEQDFRKSVLVRKSFFQLL